MQNGFWATLSDTLIPGEGAFPSASAADIVARFETRLQDLRGEQHLADIQDAFSAEGQFARLDGPARIDAVTAFARAKHVVFEEMLAVLYLCYYESALVTAAIGTSEPAYHNPPQPTGYAMSAFDPHNTLEYPCHGRGHYVSTAEVRRVELSGLTHLVAPIDRP